MSKDFAWGDVVKRHIIGTHVIVEYVVGQKWLDAGKTRFFTENAQCDTLEEAMLRIVCHKFSPDDWHLPYYAARLIGIPKEYE